MPPSVDTATPYVRLAEADNVVVLTRAVDRGEAFAGVDGEMWTMDSRLEVGNKLAAVPIAAGARVLKVGVPIARRPTPLRPERTCTPITCKVTTFQSTASRRHRMATAPLTEWLAYPRGDGRKGIRNLVAVAYLVECAHHVAREIAAPYGESSVHVIGFPGCYPNDYASRMLTSLCTHPNVGAVLLVSLGCESFSRKDLHDAVALSGRPVETLVIQERGGTRSTVAAGREFVEAQIAELARAERVPMSIDELVVGTVCGGSDGTSGLTANPAVGRAFDRLVDAGATCIFEETLEMVGLAEHLAQRAVSPDLGNELRESVAKAERYSTAMDTRVSPRGTPRAA